MMRSSSPHGFFGLDTHMPWTGAS